MNVSIDWELASDVAAGDVPDAAAVERWVAAALAGRRADAHVDLRVMGEAEMAALNERFRGRSGATNVLSFPAELAAPEFPLLGDLALCAPVVAREAAAQGKPPVHHWAHLVVHGVLHLLGFDHLEPGEAEVMEARERRVLASLGIPDPYELPPGSETDPSLPGEGRRFFGYDDESDGGAGRSRKAR